jgi:hypothetical protein
MRGMTIMAVAGFLYSLAETGTRRAATLATYISALNFARKLVLLEPLPCGRGSLLGLLCESYERVPAAAACPRPPGRSVRLPITAAVLRDMVDHCGPFGQFDDLMMWAAVTMAVFGLLRSGEFTVPPDRGPAAAERALLRLRHVSWAPSFTGFTLCLPFSKTDQTGVGTLIAFRRMPTVPAICPARALAAYLVARKRLAPATVGDSAPLFITSDGRPLTKARLVDWTRGLLSRVPHLAAAARMYGGHSFRHGGAQTLQLAGLPLPDIMHAGRWRSSAALAYLAPSAGSAAHLAHIVAHLDVAPQLPPPVPSPSPLPPSIRPAADLSETRCVRQRLEVSPPAVVMAAAPAVSPGLASDRGLEAALAPLLALSAAAIEPAAEIPTVAPVYPPGHVDSTAGSFFALPSLHAFVHGPELAPQLARRRAPLRAASGPARNLVTEAESDAMLAASLALVD